MATMVFLRTLGLLSVLLLICVDNVATQTCNISMNYSGISNPNYTPSPSTSLGGVEVLNQMVHVFLAVVQPKSFPGEFLIKVIKGSVSFSDPSVYKEAVLYEVGFLVCAIIGLLFIILMPLVGFFFCCCRCCGNCGGKMHQKQTKRTNCRRRALACSLLLITTIILAGNICTFVSNEKATTSIRDSTSLINQTVDNLKTFINVIPQQINGIFSASEIPIQNVSANINNIGPLLGGMILSRLGQFIYPVLNNASQRAQEINYTAANLILVNQTTPRLQDKQIILEQNLTSVRTAINNTINSMTCSNCRSVQGDVDGLVIDADYSKTVIDLSSDINKVNSIANRGLGNFVQKGFKAFNDTPQMVTNQTKTLVSDVQKQLQGIRSQIKDAYNQIPITSSLGNLSSELDKGAGLINTYVPTVKYYDYYRWIAGVVLCCMILLIVVCNYLGLLMGAAGLRSSVDPTQRSCAANSGGNFFMAGTGFSFIFSWLFMILVLIMFLVGGNGYTLICKPWSTQELFKFLDTPDLISGFNLANILGLKNTTLNISDIYSECKKNDPLWNTLQLGKVVDLDSMLNLNKYTGDITANFEKTNIDISSITLLESDGKNILTDFSNSGLNSLNLSLLSQQAAKNFTKTDLLSLSSKLKLLAINLTSTTIQNQLRNEADQLVALNNWINTSMAPDAQTLRSSIKYLDDTLPQIPTKFNETLRQVEEAQSRLNSTAADIIKTESKAFLKTQLCYFDNFVNWTKDMLTNQVARCKPAANAVDAAYTIACAYFVDSLNSCWFCLGWCTIFLIPSIILSVKLAKYYRRMKKSDVYEDPRNGMEMMDPTKQFNIPRAVVKH